MVKFLKKIILFGLPIIVIGIILEVLLRNIPNDYKLKNEYLKNNSKNIEVLILGSSHSYYGLDPEMMSGEVFNASYVSQSLEYDFKIYNKFKDNLTRLEYIVIAIDYSTLFSKLSITNESWRLKNYAIYQGYDLGWSLKSNFELFSMKFNINTTRIFNYYWNGKTSVTSSDKGYGSDKRNNKDLIQSGKAAAKRHTKEDKSFYIENLTYLDEIIASAKVNDVKVLFYSSPCYHTYMRHLDQIQLNLVLTTMDSICKVHSHCVYHNLMEMDSFSNVDFRDADHLSRPGAIKLSGYMDSLIKVN